MKSGRINLSRVGFTLLAILIALGAYALILWLPIPAAVGLFVRYNLVLLSIIALPLLFVVFRINGFIGKLAALGITLILFGLPLSGLWRSGASEPFIIAGLLPFSDAASYYSDALRVVEGYRFSAFSARRPLFPALLTVLLAVTNQNLVLTIAILTALIACACYLGAREIQRSHGTLTAVVFLYILFLFYRRISGTTMTENLGLPLGVTAFVVLWSASKSKTLWKTALGLLLLTLALNARAGTFFILPALILWSGFAYRGKRKFSLLAIGINTATVACGFLLNMLVFTLIADPGGMVFSNFSYTLYGVVAGGKGWMQILVDHPELAQLDDVARSAQTYVLVFEEWRAHPFNIFVGAAKNWFDYLMPRGAGAFGFVRGQNMVSWINYAVRILLSMLAGWGLVISGKKRKNAPHGMMLWAAVGIFLSVPFVPPNDSNQMRVYAATVAFLIAVCAIGLESLLSLRKKIQPEPILQNQAGNLQAVIFGIAVSLVTICGALLVKATHRPQELALAECPAGQTQFLARFTAGSLVEVVGEGQSDTAPLLRVPVESMYNVVEGYLEMHEALVEQIGEGTVLARPLDLLSMQYPLLILPNPEGQIPMGLVNICAAQPENEELSTRGWWLVISITHLE